MKKTIKFLLLAILSSATFSCSNDDNNGNVIIEDPASTHYKITVSGTAVTNGFCTGSTNSSYSIKTDYLSDQTVSDTELWNGNGDNVLISDSKIISGNIIGVKISLNDFQINNPNSESGKGTEFKNVSIKIENNETNEVILNEQDITSMFICTDVLYEAKLLYNISTDSFSFNTETYGF